MKIGVIGLGKHGKDFFCEILEKHFGIKFTSSSSYMNDNLVFEKLKDKYSYKTKEECFADRHNHRVEWYEIIQDYNKEDQEKLARNILKENDIYCGMRCKKQFESSRYLFDVVVWVDAFERLGQTESKESMSIPKEYADIVIYNNGSKEEFIEKVVRLGSTWFGKIDIKTIEDRKKDFYEEVAKFKGVYSDAELSNFYRYWTEHSDAVRSNTKMKFEKQKTFNVSLRLRTWNNNSKKFSIAGMLNKRRK